MSTDVQQDTVAQLEEEVAQLQQQQDSAVEQAEKAGQRLEQIHSQCVALAPAAFSGDSEATKQLASLEDEAASLTRTIRVAKDAASELDRVIGATKEELAEARRELHRKRCEELTKEAREIDRRRDGLAQQLKAVLEQQSALGWKMSEEVRHYDEDQANVLSLGVAAGHREWLTETFRAWLR
jgi:chromosome segregation ATPase